MTNKELREKRSKNMTGKTTPTARHEFSLFRNRYAWLIIGLLVALKSSLMRSYTSTDFEVHRNWMAIAHNVPLKEWYYNNVSIWTLDYPPFFAYFEKALSIIASRYNETILELKKEPLMNDDVLVFQRISVIATDLVYMMGSMFLSAAIINGVSWASRPLKNRLKVSLFALMVCNPGLILLDNIHFQYNSMLYGLLCFSLTAIYSDSPIKSALWFAVLLNFKHIFLYYVPAFVLYFVFCYLPPFDKGIFSRTVKLALSVIAPVIFSFGPFVFQDGLEAFQQILSRLFPFKRGLTHSYWSPNFWAIYNFVDYATFKILRNFKLQDKCLKFFDKCGKVAPTYTSGLVEEYDHSMLMNITPPKTLILIVAFLLPVVLVYLRKGVKEKLIVSLILSAYSFYLFGWHVHEKAILMVSIPMTLLVFKDLRYKDAFLLLTTTGHVSLLPLFFTPLEGLVKYCLVMAYFVCILVIFFYCYRLTSSNVISRFNGVFFIVLGGLETYKVFIHRAVFEASMEFLPLMLTSVICSIGIIVSYVEFLYLTFFESTQVNLTKRRCLMREVKVKKTEMTCQEIDLDSINRIGGIDISICSTNPDLAVISYSIFTYPELELIFTDDTVVYLPVPYIPEYLAIREADPLTQIVKKNSRITVDVLLIDGNGKFHSRRCGLASHVGYLTGLPTIGVSKNFNGFPIVMEGFSKEDVDRLDKEIHEKCRSLKNGAVLSVDGVDPDLLRIVRPENSVNPLYVSSGFAINLDTATTIFTQCLRESIPEPIRLCDLRSRALVDKFFFS